MPGKLRKSRSRNNNRPASRQSRKRKTPKNNVSKGKARKTTRRRVKRGGMFGFGSPSKELKKAVHAFMLVVIIHFLITRKKLSYWSNDTNDMKSFNEESSLFSLLNSNNPRLIKDTDVIDFSVEFKDINIVETLQTYLKNEQIVSVNEYIRKKNKNDPYARRQTHDELKKEARSQAQNFGEEKCAIYFTKLKNAFDFATNFFNRVPRLNVLYESVGEGPAEVKKELIPKFGDDPINNFDSIMKKCYGKSYNDFFTAIDNKELRKQKCVLIELSE